MKALNDKYLLYICYLLCLLIALTLTMLNFLNEIIFLKFLALSIIIFGDIKMKTCHVGQPTVLRAWSDCTDVQAGQALYWWQRLITFGVGRIRVNIFFWYSSMIFLPFLSDWRSTIYVGTFQKIWKKWVSFSILVTIHLFYAYLFWRSGSIVLLDSCCLELV